MEELKMRVKRRKNGHVVTFFLENERDATTFHDKVAINVIQGPHESLGHIFNIYFEERHGRSHREYPDDVTYTVPIRD